MTVAATGLDAPAAVSVKPLGSVVESIARENVAVTAVLRETPVLPFAGVLPVTVGGVPEAVVKLQPTALESALPEESLIVVRSLAV